MKNLFVCIITSKNNNKQCLVSILRVPFLRVFFIKELACSVVVHEYFDQTGNTVDNIIRWQHLNQYINIYFHREFHKTGFICCFVVTAENLI